MEKIYRQVRVIDRLPIEDKEYDTDLGKLEFFTHWKAWRFDKKPKWWLEPVELPSEEDIKSESKSKGDWYDIENFIKGANYILNTLKGEKSNG